MDYLIFFFMKTMGGTVVATLLVHNGILSWLMVIIIMEGEKVSINIPQLYSPASSHLSEVTGKKASPVGTSALRLKHPALLICKVNSSGMQGTRSKALRSWRSIQNSSLTLLHDLEQAIQEPEDSSASLPAKIGAWPLVVCPIRWHWIRTNCTDQWNNDALLGLPRGFLYLLLGWDLK